MPYYIIRYEKSVHEISSDPEKLEKLLAEFSEIREKLEHDLCDNAKAILYGDLIELIVKISNYIFRSEDDAKKGLGEAMGGKVLELHSEKMKRLEQEAREAREIGAAEGRAKGEDMLANLISKLISSGRTDELQKIIENKDLRNKLYSEFKIK